MTGLAEPANQAIEILIAEDSATQAEHLCLLLEDHHYRVTVATDGQAALDWLSQHIPAMVISDINMPRLNGYDLCRQIQADPRLDGVPVILLTSLSDVADVLEGLACGADPARPRSVQSTARAPPRVRCLLTRS